MHSKPSWLLTYLHHKILGSGLAHNFQAQALLHDAITSENRDGDKLTTCVKTSRVDKLAALDSCTMQCHSDDGIQIMPTTEIITVARATQD